MCAKTGRLTKRACCFSHRLVMWPDIQSKAIMVKSHSHISPDRIYRFTLWKEGEGKNTRKTKEYFILFYLLNPHLRVCLLIFFFLFERQEGRERETSKSENISWLPPVCQYAPQLGIEPPTFWFTRRGSNQLSHQARAKITVLITWVILSAIPFIEPMSRSKH